jgi:hypothetical protein
MVLATLPKNNERMSADTAKMRVYETCLECKIKNIMAKQAKGRIRKPAKLFPARP